MNLVRRAAAAAGLAALAACQSVPGQHDAASPALAAALTSRVQSAYVEPFRSGDIDRWVQVFADNALAYHDGPPAMKGREAIRGFGNLVQRNFEIKVFDVVVDEVRSNGTWALTAGHYSALFAPRSGDAYAGAIGPRQGKFMFVWAQQNGVWRIISDMGNSTDPPPKGGSR